MNNPPITILNYIPQRLLTIDPKIVWLFFVVIVVVFVLISTILVYHWITYSYAPKTTARAIKIYSIGSCLFILIALFGCIQYSLSL